MFSEIPHYGGKEFPYWLWPINLKKKSPVSWSPRKKAISEAILTEYAPVKGK